MFHHYFFKSISASQRQTLFPLINTLSSFFTTFLIRGNLTKIRYFIHHCLVFFTTKRMDFLLTIFFFKTSSIFKYLLFFFTRTKFLFYFFYAKTNKKLFKFARYRLPRFYVRYFFIKPHKRLKKLLFILRKTFLISYHPGLSFRRNLFKYFLTIFYNPICWTGHLLLKKLHRFIFKNHRRRLFFFNKSV